LFPLDAAAVAEALYRRLTHCETGDEEPESAEEMDIWHCPSSSSVRPRWFQTLMTTLGVIAGPTSRRPSSMIPSRDSCAYIYSVSVRDRQ
jgi:hypothetical protein